VQKVLIFSNSSLLAQGVTSRLSQFPSQIELSTTDPKAPDLLERIIEARPDILIFEASEYEKHACCLLINIFEQLPDTIILRLHTTASSVQVIKSSCFGVANVNDLVALLNDTGGFSASAGPILDTPQILRETR
jgi:hypothetical protein